MHGAAVSLPLGGSVRACARRLPQAGRWAGVIGLLLCLHLPCSAAGQELVTKNPNKVKAAYLRNFAHYMTWPANSFASTNSPWRIGVLGDDPFGDVLEKTFKDRTEQDRPFVVFRAKTLDQLPPCQIVFIAENDATKRRAALAALKDQPVLTVGDAPEFLREGGIIRFQVADRVEMSVNLDQARAVSLKIHAQMMECSREVLENGAVRKLR